MNYNSVGFTGTRQGMTWKQLLKLEDLIHGLISPNETHSGDCLGADAEFAFCVSSNTSIYRVGHPCTIKSMRAFCRYDKQYAPKAPLARNKDIVDASDVLIACPRSTKEEQRSGTWATIRYARMLQRPAIIIWPDGTIKKERT